MSPRLRRLVRNRARRRCEYCRLHENDLPLWSFHADHIVAEQHSGSDVPANLAWACQRCNLFKGTNLTTIDPQTGKLARVFNPRNQQWDKHFKIENTRIGGLTPTGRATARLLQMNVEERTDLRAELAALGHWPPS